MRSHNEAHEENTSSIVSYIKPLPISTITSYINTQSLNAITPYLNANTLNTIASYMRPSIDTIAAYLEPIAMSIKVSAFFNPTILPPIPTAIAAIEDEEPKKKGRSKSKFSTNKTASIALPITPKKIIKKVESNAIISTDSTSKIYAFLNSMMSYLLNKPETPTETKIITYPDITPISVKMRTLENQCHELEDPTKLDDLILEKVKLVDDLIKEHAARRVDLFFYLLLVVHGKNVTVTKDATIKQHGIGSKETGTQACHSSLLPNVKLKPIPFNKSRLMQPPAAPTLSGTQFDETLNMTIELPNAVNAFDGHLEGRFQPTKYTKRALAILNRASKNEIDPREGMNEFLKIMDEFFSDFETKHLKSDKCETPKATKLIWECEKAGTFIAANKDKLTISDDYLYLMLRLKPAEKQKVTKNPKLLSGFYKQAQEEILNSKAVKKQSRRHPQLMSK